MKIFYHTDADGDCSGAIAMRAVGAKREDMVRINYGDPFPWHEVVGEDVIMVDFSLQPFEDMLRLRDLAKSLVWIDHHASAIRELEKSGEAFEGIQREGLAGCELAWRYYHPEQKIPHAVRLIGRYDVWDWRDTPGALEFQYGLKVRDSAPWSRLWNMLIVPYTVREQHGSHAMAQFTVQQIIEQGGLILKYKRQDDAQRAQTSAFAAAFAGHPVIAINHQMTNSQVFDEVRGKFLGARFLVTFGYRKGLWHVGLYNDEMSEVDVGELAKEQAAQLTEKHGVACSGGGHPSAAGFQSPKPPEITLPDGSPIF